MRGSVRNTGVTAAANVRMTVTALDEKGETIASGDAGLSNGVVDPGGTVSFSVTIPVGEKFVGSIRFAPQWIASAAPGPRVRRSRRRHPRPPRPAPPRIRRRRRRPTGGAACTRRPRRPLRRRPRRRQHRLYPRHVDPENQPKPPQ